MASEFQKLDPGEQWALANGINTYSGVRKVYNWKTNDIDNEFSTMSQADRDHLRNFTTNKRKEYERIDQNVARDKAAWAAYGGNPLTAPNPDGSDAWKMNPKLKPDGMKNPVMIDTLYNSSYTHGDITKPGGRYSPEGGAWMQSLYYDKPVAKKPALPANLSGGQATVPSVQQRMMSRMGQAVQKGVNKGKIKSSQLGKYQVTGQAAPAATASPLVNQLGKGPGFTKIDSNPYYYKPVKPDFSSINPNDPDEIRYQQKIKAQQEAGKNGGAVNKILYSTKARNDIMDKTAEINRLGQERMTAARKADPRSKDIVTYTRQ